MRLDMKGNTVITKDKVRKLIVELVMCDWSNKVASRSLPKFKAYVRSLHPDASVSYDGKTFVLNGVTGLKCTMSSEAGVWALAAKELAR